MKLIPHWRRAWRLLSVQLAALIVVWVGLPSDAQGAVVGLLGVEPERVPGVLALLLIVARLIDQPRARGE